MKPTDEQAVMLAAIERKHGQVHRIPDDSSLGDLLLSNCVTDARAYHCGACQLAFTIEPDGECSMWALVPIRS